MARAGRSNRIRGAAAGVVCLLLGLTGCIHRSLTIQTDPPGAAVYVNDEYQGESPLTYDFRWYGWYRVRLEQAGYEKLHDRKLLDAPVKFWIPLDLLMELLPFPVRDDRTWSYTLKPESALSIAPPPRRRRAPEDLVPGPTQENSGGAS